jgi:7-cyano-7-deazaguanine synthase
MVLLSGGLDSTVALAAEHAAGRAHAALSVDYGQRHNRELGNARAVANHYRTPNIVLDMSNWGTLVTSSLTDPNYPVPHGHYESPEMKSTVVPNRNATLLMAAAGIAISADCDTVVIAAHAGDAAIYPDCRPAFIAAANESLKYATDGAVSISAPFLGMNKTGVVRLGAKLGAPFEFTWSCYEGGNLHCGECGACVERRGSFTDAGVTDPTTYIRRTEVAS